LKIKNIPVNLIDVADENVRKNFSFGKDSSDNLMKEHLAKFELLQPVVGNFFDFFALDPHRSTHFVLTLP
jgi:ParB family chromosome partitioning protein